MINISSNQPGRRSPVHPLSSITGRHSYSFFEIRPESDLVVIRDYETDGVVLTGVLILCLQSPLRIEDVHLQLTGTLRHLYGYPLSSGESAVSYLTKVAYSSVDPRLLSQKVRLLEHRWQSFVGSPGKGMVLHPGNYEWPFEFEFPRNTIESVEGIPELSVTYTLKATVGRGKFAHDLHTYRQLRIIRAPSPDALDLIQPVSVEDIWANKIEYSIATPQKAVAFGGTIPIEMRFTPLLKGLELQTITAKFIEIREWNLPGQSHLASKSHRTERTTSTWKVNVTREEFWQTMVEETGQEGWVITKSLDLPKELDRCIQDLSLDSIKVRHRLVVIILLRNPDGHVSELLARLPLSVIFYPSIAFDKHGKLIRPLTSTTMEGNSGEVILPVYGEHVYDELYDDQNAPPSPEGRIDSMSRVDVGPDTRSRSTTVTTSDHSQGADAMSFSSREASPGEALIQRGTAQQLDEDPRMLEELERVPSYQTALRTPFRQHTRIQDVELPSYRTSISHSQHNNTRL